MPRACRQHDEAVEAEGYPAGVGHVREGLDEPVIDRVSFAVDPFLLVHGVDEAFPLFPGIGQFGEAVGKLDSARIELEAFGETGIIRSAPRQRGFRSRIVAKKGRT